MSSQDLLLGNNYIIQWLANLISLSSSGQIQFLQPTRPHQQSSNANLNSAPNLLARLTSPISSTPTSPFNHLNNGALSTSGQHQPTLNHPFDQASLNLLESLNSLNDAPFNNNTLNNTNNLQTRQNHSFGQTGLNFLESLYSINDDPNEEAIDLIAQRLNSTVNNGQSGHSFDQASLSLLESLYSMNDDPAEEAIDLIAQRLNSTNLQVTHWFQTRRETDRNAYDSTHLININNKNNTNASNALCTFKAQPPNVPSSSLLAKLNAVTSRPDAHIVAEKLDQKMVALLEAFYAINDNPEPAAIEMIAKRINVTVEAISDWFNAKCIERNPNAGPRSPPVKKREGGRVVTFSEYQRSLLEAIFDENNYLHPQEYEELSNLIQVPSRNIKIWFKNRRSKQRLSGRTTTTPKNYELEEKLNG